MLSGFKTHLNGNQDCMVLRYRYRKSKGIEMRLRNKCLHVQPTELQQGKEGLQMVLGEQYLCYRISCAFPCTIRENELTAD